jgi:hypothetical protein
MTRPGLNRQSGLKITCVQKTGCGTRIELSNLNEKRFAGRTSFDHWPLNTGYCLMPAFGTGEGIAGQFAFGHGVFFPGQDSL